MPLASATTAVDIDQWLAGNTAYCARYQARLSSTACEQNRKYSREDLRCEGCGGLHDQPPLPALRLVYPARPEFHKEPEPAPLPGETDTGDVCRDEFASLDQAREEDEDLSLLDDLEIELSAAQLEALCPGLAAEIGELVSEEIPSSEEQARADRRKRKPRRGKVAVFMGRCHRCGQYMVNDRERQFSEKDEGVYRCYTCGWRVSPVYVFNRGNPGISR
jgi:hypothetical protein